MRRRTTQGFFGEQRKRRERLLQKSPLRPAVVRLMLDRSLWGQMPFMSLRSSGALAGRDDMQAGGKAVAEAPLGQVPSARLTSIGGSWLWLVAMLRGPCGGALALVRLLLRPHDGTGHCQDDPSSSARSWDRRWSGNMALNRVVSRAVRESSAHVQLRSSCAHDRIGLKLLRHRDGFQKSKQPRRSPLGTRSASAGPLEVSQS